MLIDNEFKNLIRPLREDELADLEQGILADGIRDALIVWNDILIDGHHRYKIAQAYNLPYEIKNVNLPDREAVKQWIINNQLARRNLTKNESSYYRGKLYESLKKSHGGNRTSSSQNGNLKTAEKIGQKQGVSKNTVIRDAEFSKAVDEVAAVVGEDIKNAILSGKANIPKKDVEKIIEIKQEAPEYVEPIMNGEMTLTKARQEIKRKQAIENLNNIKTREAKRIEGVFDVIVIDPPWEMKKIERDVAPNQVEFEYPTMTIDELKLLGVPYSDDCHVWLWTTHKYLPSAFDLLNEWGLKYVCTFVWHKPGGFQPFDLPQYNCEFALYARRGSPKFTDLKNFKLCFEAPRGSHSEKPQAFYDLVKRVTAGRRLDMFNRREIDGFETWGKEAK